MCVHGWAVFLFNSILGFHVHAAAHSFIRRSCRLHAQNCERARLFIDCILLLLRHSARGHTQKWTQTAAINCARLPKIINGPHSQGSVIFSSNSRTATTTLVIILSRSNIHLFIYDLRKRFSLLYGIGPALDCVGRSIQINSSKCNWKTIWTAVWFYYMCVIHAALQQARFASFHSRSRNRSWHWFSFGLAPNRPHSDLLCLAESSLDSKYSRSGLFHTLVRLKEKGILNGWYWIRPKRCI